MPNSIYCRDPTPGIYLYSNMQCIEDLQVLTFQEFYVLCLFICEMLIDVLIVIYCEMITDVLIVIHCEVFTDALILIH